VPTSLTCRYVSSSYWLCTDRAAFLARTRSVISATRIPRNASRDMIITTKRFVAASMGAMLVLRLGNVCQPANRAEGSSGRSWPFARIAAGAVRAARRCRDPRTFHPQITRANEKGPHPPGATP